MARAMRTFEMESRVSIAAPPGHIYALLADPARWPEWSRVCEATWDAKGPSLQAGQTFGFRLRMGGRPVSFTVTVTEARPPLTLAWQSTRCSVTATRTFTVTPAQPGCVVSDHKRFSSSLLPVGLWYPRWLIREMTENWLGELRAGAEAEAAR
jgi:uncharacterized protein YndB with AHSA1/START domain